MQAKNCDDLFYGSVTVGERGQIVIPHEARTELGIRPGDKLLVMRDPVCSALRIGKFDAAYQFIEEFRDMLNEMESKPSVDTDGDE
ncbi:AbrB/MazE/SpoVT family DNA-binding domain-containing protein [Kamptonema cortianum]|nr:AbrB/MazE/SpoVT family DNA-binding domain-containing protein [Geitlerinema splendidum]MDK3162159.1 AbrB/MazE/SpoVT family DNA-binding domain-containing protein [Kamptonema cortianum]